MRSPVHVRGIVSLAYDPQGDVRVLVNGRMDLTSAKGLTKDLYNHHDGNVRSLWNEIRDPEVGRGLATEAKTDRAIRNGDFD
jgi:hypothetical protein